MKNILVIQIRVKMTLFASKKVPDMIACVNRGGLETTVNWILMNVMEVGIPCFSRITRVTKELKIHCFFFL